MPSDATWRIVRGVSQVGVAMAMNYQENAADDLQDE